jgi:OOP family OmpA-OmpF porin
MIIGMLFVFGCAGPPAKQAPSFSPVDLNPKIKSGEYVQKVQTFLVILDASGTMMEDYKGKRKFNLAQDVVSRMNQTIPDIKLMAGLRTLGQNWSTGSALKYGMTDYNKGDFEKTLMAVSGFGMTPLGTAIAGATGDLAGGQGNMALIVVSDGKETDHSALQSAKAMKAKYGDRICIYTVLIGDDAGGKTLMEQIVQAGGCGFAVNGDDIYDASSMAGFVTMVFLEKSECPDADHDGVCNDDDKCPNTPKGVKVDGVGCPLDSDGDGVPDYLDKCPNTPKGVEVNTEGCPLDTDGDGVYDYLDRCPGTPLGAKVDDRGCWVLNNLHFDYDKAEIKPVDYPILDEALSVMKKNPGLRISVQGHTCSMGSAGYNKKLSMRRAGAVAGYFKKKGIAADRLEVEGYGLTQPVASNLTEEGRVKNRRVELHPVK